jgi:hypothetical protein
MATMEISQGKHFAKRALAMLLGLALSAMTLGASKPPREPQIPSSNR